MLSGIISQAAKPDLDAAFRTLNVTELVVIFADPLKLEAFVQAATEKAQSNLAWTVVMDWGLLGMVMLLTSRWFAGRAHQQQLEAKKTRMPSARDNENVGRESQYL